MAKIYILGNKEHTVWAGQLGELVTVPTITVNQSEEIHDFVCRFLGDASNDSKVIIDLDAMAPALALTIAMHIRLSVADLKEKSFVPLLLVSNYSLQSFLIYGECSQLFLSSKGVALCSPDIEELKLAAEAISGLTAADYKSEFLDKINIRPDETIGRHSMANQWGADVLYRIVSKDAPQVSAEMISAKKKLYYKYVYLQTAGVSAALHDAGSAANRSGMVMFAASGKNILLIDDEAHRGWSDVLGKWLLNYKTFDVENGAVATYDDISADIREKIERDFYDLYLLDLRLLGNEEDNIYDADSFSGMKVLKKIKEINQGNQVIIMTASNKAWNMKALVEAGADGYYIKESPEQQLPESFSKANFDSFKRDVETALGKNGYRKSLCRDARRFVKQILSSTRIDGDLADELVSALRASLRQILSAKQKKDFAYAYLTLYQSLEMIASFFVTDNGTSGWLIDGIHELRNYNLSGRSIVPEGRVLLCDTKYPSIYSRLLGIYVELCKGADVRFASSDINIAIARRHAFVHNDTDALADHENAKIYDEQGYKHLLSVLETIVTPLL